MKAEIDALTPTKGRLLITGGNGMVGRNIREHSLAADWELLSPGSDEVDLTDARSVADYLSNTRPDAVIHAAGLVGGIHANMARPVDFLSVNTIIGNNIVLGARSAGVERFINLASTCMYPRDHEGALGEDLILKGELEPTNEGYALAKIFTTRLCQYVRRENPELHYKTLIPCNLYGRHDKFDPTKSHLVPAVIHKMHLAKVNGLKTVDIWGDGTARREFLYAGDLADAALRALDDIKVIPELMNVGLGTDYSIDEYYAEVADVVGWSGEFVHDLSKPVGMRNKLADIGLLTNWGWSAPTSLSMGLRQTYAFYLSRIQA